MSSEKYEEFDNDLQIVSSHTSIGDGPTLNEIPSARVKRGLICGIFRKPRWCDDGFKVLVAGAVIFTLTVGIALVIDVSLRNHTKRLEVVTDDEQCTSLVRHLLETTDSNAVDGAIAGILCLSITRPDQTSLMSGGFMVFHSNEQSGSIDFQFQATGERKKSFPVAMPGLVAGLLEAHKQYGRLKWSRLIQDCISLANRGFQVHKHTDFFLNKYYGNFSSNMRKMFTNELGNQLKEGDVLKLPKVADLLHSLSKEDIGPLRKDLMKSASGPLGWTDKTFGSYKVKHSKPLESHYKDLQLVTTTPLSSGFALLMALKLLSHLTATSDGSPLQNYLGIAETLKTVFEEKSLMLDEAVLKNITAEQLRKQVDDWLSDSSIKKIVEKINNFLAKKDAQRNTNTGKPSNVWDVDMASARVLVIDHDGEAVTITSSLGHVFGNKEMTQSGIVLNDAMNLFPDSWKFSSGSSRPISTSSPFIAIKHKTASEETERSAFAATNTEMGLAALIQVASNIFQRNKGISAATLSEARLFYDVQSGVLSYEGGQYLSNRIVALELTKYYGPSISETQNSVGHVELVTRDEKEGQSLKDLREL